MNSEPVYVLNLFPKVNTLLIDLLRSLSKEDWNKATVCKLWNVKDIAAHLLDGNMRRVSIQRDDFFYQDPSLAINSYQDLVKYLNNLNADWVNAFRRVSPAIIIELLEKTGNEVYHIFKDLDPYGEALFSVSWAGETKSQNWFDIAREYTERWLHQQQIRLAVNKPGLLSKELYYPFLDIFMRALPHTYRDIEAEENATIMFEVTGEGGGRWILVKKPEKWELSKIELANYTSHVVIDGEIAWRLFSKGIDINEAKKRVDIKGDIGLGEVVLNMVSVMA